MGERRTFAGEQSGVHIRQAVAGARIQASPFSPLLTVLAMREAMEGTSRLAVNALTSPTGTPYFVTEHSLTEGDDITA